MPSKFEDALEKMKKEKPSLYGEIMKRKKMYSLEDKWSSMAQLCATRAAEGDAKELKPATEVAADISRKKQQAAMAEIQAQVRKTPIEKGLGLALEYVYEHPGASISTALTLADWYFRGPAKTMAELAKRVGFYTLTLASDHIDCFLTPDSKTAVRERFEKELIASAHEFYIKDERFKALHDALAQTDAKFQTLNVSVSALAQRFSAEEKARFEKLAEIKTLSTAPDQIAKFQQEYTEHQLQEIKALSAQAEAEIKYAELNERVENIKSGIAISHFIVGKVLNQPQLADQLKLSGDIFNSLYHNIGQYKLGQITALTLTGNLAGIANVIFDLVSGSRNELDELRQQLAFVGKAVVAVHKDMIRGFAVLEKNQQKILEVLEQITKEIGELKNASSQTKAAIKDVMKQLEYLENKEDDIRRKQSIQKVETLCEGIHNRIDLLNDSGKFTEVLDRLHEIRFHATKEVKMPYYTGAAAQTETKLITAFKQPQNIAFCYDQISQLYASLHVPISRLKKEYRSVDAISNPAEWALSTRRFLEILTEVLKKYHPSTLGGRVFSVSKFSEYLSSIWLEGLELLHFTNIAGDRNVVQRLGDDYKKAGEEMARVIVSDVKAQVATGTTVSNGSYLMVLNERHKQKLTQFELAAQGLRVGVKLNVMRQADFKDPTAYDFNEDIGVFSVEAVLAVVHTAMQKSSESVFSELQTAFQKTTELAYRRTRELDRRKTIPDVQDTLMLLAGFQSLYLPECKLESPRDVLDKIENRVTVLSLFPEQLVRNIGNNSITTIDLRGFDCNYRQPIEEKAVVTTNEVDIHAKFIEGLRTQTGMPKAEIKLSPTLMVRKRNTNALQLENVETKEAKKILEGSSCWVGGITLLSTGLVAAGFSQAVLNSDRTLKRSTPMIKVLDPLASQSIKASWAIGPADPEGLPTQRVLPSALLGLPDNRVICSSTKFSVFHAASGQKWEISNMGLDIWNATTGQKEKTLSLKANRIQSLTMLPNGCFACVCQYDPVDVVEYQIIFRKTFLEIWDPVLDVKLSQMYVVATNGVAFIEVLADGAIKVSAFDRSVSTCTYKSEIDENALALVATALEENKSVVDIKWGRGHINPTLKQKIEGLIARNKLAQAELESKAAAAAATSVQAGAGTNSSSSSAGSFVRQAIHSLLSWLSSDSTTEAKNNTDPGNTPRPG